MGGVIADICRQDGGGRRKLTKCRSDLRVGNAIKKERKEEVGMDRLECPIYSFGAGKQGGGEGSRVRG